LRGGLATGPGWWDIKPTEIHPGLAQAALRFLTCHRDGRVREAAILSLDDRPAGIRWLLLRINDWHEPLAELTVSKVVHRLLLADGLASLLESRQLGSG
jgi:hypothetical protein